MRQRALGEVTVGAIGLGGMPMSIEGRPEAARSVATIHAALDAGVTLIDTADAYHRDGDGEGEGADGDPPHEPTERRKGHASSRSRWEGPRPVARPRPRSGAART